ncbi:uncharacterized protein G2W53_017199 [Senna tora]|uniref:Reverse transcriptase domain-containing protein n=1 Tax=Senna tora TaxID=362788 RepID=A0A834TQ11_9FABA|nr:uncharacterized protein G2W53_017199 [Senna tora]
MYADDILLSFKTDELTRTLSCKRVDHLGKYLGGFIDALNTERRNASLILDNLEKKLAGASVNLLAKDVHEKGRGRTGNSSHQVGNEEKIYLKDDKWITMDKKDHGHERLSGLMHLEGYWNDVKEKLVWKPEANDRFSVRKASQMLSSNGTPMPMRMCSWLNIWRVPIPHKIMSNNDFNQHVELIALSIAICWSIYSQRIALIFQQGRPGVEECLHRAYGGMDGFKAAIRLKGMDHFFKIDNSIRERREINATQANRNQSHRVYCS